MTNRFCRRLAHVALAALTGGCALLTAPAAHANGFERVLGYMFQDNGYQGSWATVQWQDMGPCDAAGYSIQLIALPDPWIFGSWGDHISSVMIASDVDQSCNYVIGWNSRTKMQMSVCYEGWLSSASVGRCNDSMDILQFVHRDR